MGKHSRIISHLTTVVGIFVLVPCMACADVSASTQPLSVRSSASAHVALDGTDWARLDERLDASRLTVTGFVLSAMSGDGTWWNGGIDAGAIVAGDVTRSGFLDRLSSPRLTGLDAGDGLSLNRELDKTPTRGFLVRLPPTISSNIGMSAYEIFGESAAIASGSGTPSAGGGIVLSPGAALRFEFRTETRTFNGSSSNGDWFSAQPIFPSGRISYDGVRVSYSGTNGAIGAESALALSNALPFAAYSELDLSYRSPPSVLGPFSSRWDASVQLIAVSPGYLTRTERYAGTRAGGKLLARAQIGPLTLETRDSLRLAQLPLIPSELQALTESFGGGISLSADPLVAQVSIERRFDVDPDGDVRTTRSVDAGAGLDLGALTLSSELDESKSSLQPVRGKLAFGLGGNLGPAAASVDGSLEAGSVSLGGALRIPFGGGGIHVGLRIRGVFAMTDRWRLSVAEPFEEQPFSRIDATAVWSDHLGPLTIDQRK